MSIYRGFEVVHCRGEHSAGWYWTDKDDQEHGPFASEDAAMNDIDKFKKEMRKA